MAINKVDYDVLTTGVSVYSNQAEQLMMSSKPS